MSTNNDLPEEDTILWNPEEYECSETSNDTMSSKKKVKIFIDKNYNKIKLNKTIIEYYSTFILPENKIRNSVTGVREKYNVGSKYEDLYFKVIDTTRNKTQSVFMFFNTPEEYEKLFMTNLSKNIKQKWYNKKQATLNLVNSEIKLCSNLENKVILVK
jgi:hypothetical protein